MVEGNSHSLENVPRRARCLFTLWMESQQHSMPTSAFYILLSYCTEHILSFPCCKLRTHPHKNSLSWMGISICMFTYWRKSWENPLYRWCANKETGSCLDPELLWTGTEIEGGEGPSPPHFTEKSQLEPSRDGKSLRTNEREPISDCDEGGSAANRVRRLLLLIAGLYRRSDP